MLIKVHILIILQQTYFLVTLLDNNFSMENDIQIEDILSETYLNNDICSLF